MNRANFNEFLTLITDYYTWVVVVVQSDTSFPVAREGITVNAGRRI